MSRHLKLAFATAVVLGLLGLAPAAAGGDYGLGRTPSPEEIAGWDIDVRPDGRGLPPGGATAADGEAIYLERCAACHGEFGEGAGHFPVLMGGEDSLKSADPVKTVGSYWPYSTTLFDYIYRAMPFGEAQSLTPEEVYAVTAYILYLNDIVDEDTRIDQHNLASVAMPNRDGFTDDPRPDTSLGEACMRDCKTDVTLEFKAKALGVTPSDAAQQTE